MEIEVFECFTYFLPLHLYLFDVNKSAGSDSIVRAKNYRGSHSSIGFTINESDYIINSTRHKEYIWERQYAKESNSCELFGRKTEGKTKPKMKKKRWRQI